MSDMRMPAHEPWPRPTTRYLAMLGVLGVVSAITPQRSSCQVQKPDSAAFVLLHSGDTVLVDAFVRSTASLSGTVRIRRQPTVTYQLQLDEQGVVRTLDMDVAQADSGAGASSRVHVTFTGDSARIEQYGVARSVRAAAGVIPVFANAIAPLELFAERAKSVGTTMVPAFNVFTRQTVDVAVRRIAGDSVTVTLGGDVERVVVDSGGRVTGGKTDRGLQILRLPPTTASAPRD